MRSRSQFIEKVVAIVLFVLVSLHVTNANFIYAADLPSTVNLSSPLENKGEIDAFLSARLFLFQGHGVSGPCYLSGFICVDNCSGYLFAVVIGYYHEGLGIRNRRVVWSANSNNPVGEGARLELAPGGNLQLSNQNGDLIWSSTTSVKSSSGSLDLTESGNLVLLDANKSIIWQSFDHPTDTLVMGQKLFPGQKLTSSVSDSIVYTLSVTEEKVIAFVDSNPDAGLYFQHPFYEHPFTEEEVKYVELRNGSVRGLPYSVINFPGAFSTQFMQLLPDGHLKLYEYQFSDTSPESAWKEVGDILGIDECSYPMACGSYGVCKYGKQCSCPANYFEPINGDQPNQGCSAIAQLNCNESGFQSLMELNQVSYFSMSTIDRRSSSIEDCKKSCLRDCSCKLATYESYQSSGICSLFSVVYSLMGYNPVNPKDTTVFLRVQNAPSPRSSKRLLIVGISAPVFFILVVIIIGWTFSVLKKKQTSAPHVVVMLLRYSLGELKSATNNFSKKLGQGGFGSVYEGDLKGGIKVAVKCLHGFGQIERSFMAEVESIGSIHHLNLVKLVGYCDDEFHNYLVYEYMTNGSLDRWIYSKNQCFSLSWGCRKNIIKDVAHGLAYLHEECRQKIIHFDVKPQNILLDENFNAKLSDFGLAKLIERNQSNVVTMMRGTPGYLAPEWLSGIVTEKVDVYSFGVVLLEIVCGRKIFEESEMEEYQPLVSLVKKKAEEGCLSHLVDKNNKDMKSHVVEIIQMMQLAIWCLQNDSRKRPSMTMVVKVLDGVMEVGTFDFGHVELEIGCPPADSAPQLPSVLSGPR